MAAWGHFVKVVKKMSDFQKLWDNFDKKKLLLNKFFDLTQIWLGTCLGSFKKS